MALSIRLLQTADIPFIVSAFTTIGWHKPAEQYERYLNEQQSGERLIRVAFREEVFAGYLTVVWQTDYPPFCAANIPEIRDLNVLPTYRRQGIALRLMDQAESAIAERSPVAGIGVGMTADYGAAQQMYVQRGYVPDGNGLYTHARPVVYGEQVAVDDGLVLYFTKTLRPSNEGQAGKAP